MNNTQAFRLKESLHGLDAGILVYADTGAAEVGIQLPHISARLSQKSTGPSFLVPTHYLAPIGLPVLAPVTGDAEQIVIVDADVTRRRLSIAIKLLAEAAEVVRNANAMDDSHADLLSRIDDALGTATPECGAMGSRCQLATNTDTGMNYCMTCGAEFQD